MIVDTSIIEAVSERLSHLPGFGKTQRRFATSARLGSTSGAVELELRAANPLAGGRTAACHS